MPAVVLPPTRNVHTTLNYYAPIGDEAPFGHAAPQPDGKLQSNVGADPHEVVINDVRGKEDTVSLDTTGFQFVKYVSQEKEFVDEEAIKNVYYKEVEQILKEQAGAKRVFIFDHTIRRHHSDDRRAGLRGPAERVHIDQTFDAGIARVRRHLGEDAERLLTGRVQIINVWRPIGHPVAHKPLAVGDWRTIDVEKDLVPVQLIYPDRIGYTFSVKHNPNHKWYFLADQTPDEVILIKCFDSKTDRARLTPHTAFVDASSPKSAPLRQSIEVRCLVFDQE